MKHFFDEVPEPIPSWDEVIQLPEFDYFLEQRKILNPFTREHVYEYCMTHNEFGAYNYTSTYYFIELHF